MKRRIAIIGGGVAGLTAGYLLDRKYDITLFEKEDRIGGNAYTYQTKSGETIDIAVGSVLNLVARNFLRLCNELNVRMVIQPGKSLISIHDPGTNSGLYLTPLSLKGLVFQRFALFRHILPQMRLLGIGHQALKLLDEGRLRGLSVGEALKLLPPLTKFDKLTMMAPFCLLSSMVYEEVLAGPAEFFFGKMKAHGKFNPIRTMLGNTFPKNLTKSYINALAARYRDRVVLSSRIKSVERGNGSVTLKMEDGLKSVFDEVVFACNADQALGLLEKPTDEERRLLGAWRYRNVPMKVHRDSSSAPRRELCQPWTCILSPKNGRPHFSISYCTWLLCPAVSGKSGYFSTQHTNFPIREDLAEFEKTFRVPSYDFASFSTIGDLPSLNGRMNTYYCGSHFGWGLHGSAVDSAIAVARCLGVDPFHD